MFVTKPKKNPTLKELIFDGYDVINSLDEIETKQKLMHWFDYLVISRDSILFKTWTLLFMSVCIFSSFFYAFQAAFRVDVEKSSSVSMFNSQYGQEMGDG